MRIELITKNTTLDKQLSELNRIWSLQKDPPSKTNSALYDAIQKQVAELKTAQEKLDVALEKAKNPVFDQHVISLETKVETAERHILSEVNFLICRIR